MTSTPLRRLLPVPVAAALLLSGLSVVAPGTALAQESSASAAVPFSGMKTWRADKRRARAPRTGGGTATGSLPSLPAESSLRASRGPKAAYVPQADVVVAPGQLTQALLSGAPEGTRFALAAGVHRLAAPLLPRAGQQLLGSPGASLNGSKVLTGWTASGGDWSVGGQTQRLPQVSAPGYTVCLPTGPLCNETEDVFLDGVMLKQVPTRAEVSPGRFFFDHATSTIWIGDDPAGRTVETTVAVAAVQQGRRNLVRNLVVEKFGNPLQRGTLEGVEMQYVDNEIRLNHGQGLSTYGGLIAGNRIVHNGQLGIGGGGTNLVVEDNEIAHNNTLHVTPEWEAGGTKWARSTGLVVRRNWTHHNYGSGFTTDIDNTATLYEQNLVEDNADIGIMHEISYAAVIRGNVVRRNGQRENWFPSRVGINVTNSRDVEVFGNLVEGNLGGGILGSQDRRTGGAHGPWGLENLSVHDNVVRAVGTGAMYAWQNGLDVHNGVVDRASYYTARNNRFFANTYHLPKADGLWFLADAPDGSGAQSVTWSAWVAKQDATSKAVAG